jgi:hypothetical protein
LVAKGEKNMKKVILLLLTSLMAATASAATDVYKFTMSLKVPQVVNNNQSKGKRVYQRQSLKGYLKVTYSDEDMPKVEITDLENHTFKVNGVNVTYVVDVSSVIWNLIGSNATGKFKTPSVCFNIEAQPSYVYAYKPTDDNSLILTLAGKGSSKKAISGYASGTLGCGCHDYGHVSPTRVMGPCGPTDWVHDMASVFGTWKIKLEKGSYSNIICK